MNLVGDDVRRLYLLPKKVIRVSLRCLLEDLSFVALLRGALRMNNWSGLTLIT